MTGFSMHGGNASIYERMLADRARTLAFRDAIRRAVKPGDVVADLGTGTGILALFAAEAGASRVFAVEARPESVALARQIVADNGFADVIEVVQADATTFHPGCPVDVVVSELIGNFGPDEALEAILGGACAAYLKPGGIAIPGSLTCHLAPVTLDGEGVGLWRPDSYGFDLSAGLRHLGWPGARYMEPARPWTPLAPPATLVDLGFGSGGARRAGDFTASFTLDRPGRLEGFMGWFESELLPGIRLTNRQRTAETSWPNWFWPVLPAADLPAGQRVGVRLDDRGEPINSLAWALDVRLG